MSIFSLNSVSIWYNCSVLEGFLNLKHLTKKVVSQNYKLSDPITKAIFKQFRRVKRDTVLGLVSRILETDEFVAVEDDSDRPIGVITHLELLNFVATDSTGKEAVVKTVSNGTLTANGTHSNGSTNGSSNGHAN